MKDENFHEKNCFYIYYVCSNKYLRYIFDPFRVNKYTPYATAYHPYWTGFRFVEWRKYKLSPSNPYILLGNAILGFFTGLIYSYLKKTKKRQIIPQTLSVLAAYLIQLPYVYITDVYFMPIPSQVVLTVILPKLLLEDMISVLISHIVLYRIELNKIL